MAVAKNRVLYQLHVALQDIDPLIWRRIQVWEDTTLGHLHHVLQIVFEWEDYHLHEFRIGWRIYSVPDPDDEMYDRKVLDERRTRLRDVVPGVGTQFDYVYDFGDNWRHSLILEAILLPDPQQSYPLCVAGARKTPHEDVGGPPGYQQYLEALGDSQHAEHETMLRWRGPFDAESFSRIKVNNQLRRNFQLKRKTATVRRDQS